MSKSPGLVALGLLVAGWCSSPGPSLGQPPPAGPVFRVDASGAHGRYPAVATSADGSFVVVWQDRFGLAIHGQRFDAAGRRQGSELAVSAGGPAGGAPSVGMAGPGDFLVAWPGGSQPDVLQVFARRFDSSGAPEGPPFEIGPGGVEPGRSVSVAMNGAGRSVVAWDRPGHDLAVQRFDAAGAKSGAEFAVEGSSPPTVTMAEDGGFLVAARDSSDSGAVARIDSMPLGI